MDVGEEREEGREEEDACWCFSSCGSLLTGEVEMNGIRPLVISEGEPGWFFLIGTNSFAAAESYKKSQFFLYVIISFFLIIFVLFLLTLGAAAELVE